MVGYIYKITNKITHQNYIGQTIDIQRRKRTHRNRLNNNTHDNPKLQASWNKYGQDNFEFESWEFQINTLQELDQLECEYPGARHLRHGGQRYRQQPGQSLYRGDEIRRHPTVLRKQQGLVIN